MTAKTEHQKIKTIKVPPLKNSHNNKQPHYSKAIKLTILKEEHLKINPNQESVR